MLIDSAVCEGCGFLVSVVSEEEQCPDILADVAREKEAHAEVHARRLAAERDLGRRLEHPQELKKLRYAGWDRIGTANSLAEAVSGAETVLKANYGRSLLHAVELGRHVEHPSPPEFIAMIPLEEDFGPEIALPLRTRYGYIITDDYDKELGVWRPAEV
jgi:hypothetical protein